MSRPVFPCTWIANPIDFPALEKVAKGMIYPWIVRNPETGKVYIGARTVYRHGVTALDIQGLTLQVQRMVE